MNKVENLKKRTSNSKIGLTENVAYQLRDKDGNIKSMFQLNSVGRAIIERARRGYSPYDSNGNMKTGRRAKLALYGLQIEGITGNWVTEMRVANGVPTVGKALVAGRINGSGTPAAVAWIGVGIGTTAYNATDTALETEREDDGSAGTDHEAASVSLVTTDTTNDTAQLVATFAFTATLAITESGAFNAATGGTLLCRQTFSAINVVSGDSLQVTWKIDVD